jgi:uncharacterized protein YcaQ
MKLATPYPLSAVRTLVLHAQGLTAPNRREAKPSLTAINKTVEQLNYIQIDTLNLIQRSQYIVLWSRLGNYSPADFDRLIYSPEKRKLFEGIQGVAAIIPLKDYHYQIPEMDRWRRNLSTWYLNWLEGQGNDKLVSVVLERIHQEGGLRALDFEYHGPKRGSWWDWKPAKIALEYLFARGDLMIANRVNFQRVYDLTERVLPKWVDTRMPTLEERDRYRIEQGLVALGICQPDQLAEYGFHMRHRYPKAIWTEMLKQRIVVPVQAILADGETHELVVHKDNLETLQKAAEGEIQVQRTTFLSFFDNLFWCRGRDMQLWGYRNLLEAYNRQENRKYGYFCLSILHHDRLVGRFDPKLERKTGVLRIKAIYLEPRIEPDEELVSDVASAMRDFMAFHQARELVIEKSQPEEFGTKILKAV